MSYLKPIQVLKMKLSILYVLVKIKQPIILLRFIVFLKHSKNAYFYEINLYSLTIANSFNLSNIYDAM